MEFQALLDKVFRTWERDHHVLFTRCIEACMGADPAAYWTCAVKCHEYFNQLMIMEVDVA
jgi:hypothetical protein